MVSRATKRARLVGIAGLVSVALTTAACGGGSGSAGQNASDSSSGGVQTIKVAAGSKLLTDWDDYVADAKGFYTKHGVKVDRVTTQTASAATQLQVTGEISVGRGLPPAVQADVKSNGNVHLIDVADTLIRPPFTVNAASSINSYQDLVGKTIAVSTPTDSTTVVTEQALAKLGIPTDNIDMNPIGGTAERLAGLQQGAVQATLMLPPLNFKAEAGGFHRIGYIPDDLGENYKFAFVSVIVNRDWAKENKALLVNYLRARNDALKFMANKSNRDEVSSILAKSTGVDDATTQKIYDLTIGGKYNAFNSEIGVDTGAAQGVLDGLKSGGFLKKREKAADYTDDSYAAAARSNG